MEGDFHVADIQTQMRFDFVEQESNAFSVNTHLGRSPTSYMGITLLHEHIFNKYPKPKQGISETFTIEQLAALEKHGVKTIVDLTPYTSPDQYTKVLEVTSINIICCVGFYLPKYIPTLYKKASVGELVKWLSNRIVDGKGKNRILPGILKVAGQNPQMNSLEEKFFATVAILQREYSLPIATHSPKGALSHIDYLIRVGANPEHVFCSHMDKGLSSESAAESRLLEATQVLDRGAYVLFSEFGSGHGTGGRSAVPAVDLISRLKEAGYIKQLLISADSNWRWKDGQLRLRGPQSKGIPRTYEYVFARIVPVLERAGFSSKDINTMLITNPRRLFEF